MMEGAVVGIEHKSWASGRPLLLWQSLPQVYYLLQWTAVKHLIVAVTQCLLSKRITTVRMSIPRREPVSRRFDALTTHGSVKKMPTELVKTLSQNASIVGRYIGEHRVFTPTILVIL